ncbi:MAG: DUF732 domain-containing protein [Mycobacterium sp.]|uniref:DUF732 domain-containing protein n=1 Tax=Mycobacterium sp. TaxID=1785 RepID=UPI003CA204B5
MKPLLALLGVTMGIILAVPAHAEPGIDESPTDENNETFLTDLHKVGIAFSDPRQAISAGQAVCAHIHNGMSGLHLIKHLQENNPGLTENGAAQFATISAKSYCPRQLDEAEEPGGGKGGGGKGGG